MTYCQSITQILRIIWVRCIPLSLRSKTRRRATPLLPAWIYSCRSRVTVSCELPFTTNVTISTSISQTFRSWIAIFHLRLPMAFLSHSSCGMPRARSSYECFILRAARLSSKLLRQGYVMERLKSSLRKCYGRYGDLIKHYEVSLPQMLHDILGHDHIKWHPQLIRHYTNLRTYYRTGLKYWFWPYYRILEVSIEHCSRWRLANRGRLLLRTPGPVPFGTCICSNVETILSWTCHVYGPFEFRTSLGNSILLIASLPVHSLFNFCSWGFCHQACCSIPSLKNQSLYRTPFPASNLLQIKNSENPIIR